MPHENSQKDFWIFILRPADEVCHPYENALQSLTPRLEWFSDYDTLVQSSQREPQIVIVDLDCLSKPLDKPLEELRRLYCKSDLIAISNTDSAKTAIQCLRSGCSDFLLKPTSPEELAWSIRKSRQRQEFLHKLDDPRTSMARVISQLSSCAVPAIVRVYALEYLQRLLGATGAAWLAQEQKDAEFSQVICAVPKMISSKESLKHLPKLKRPPEPGEVMVIHNKQMNDFKALIPCANHVGEGILVWGIQDRPSPRMRTNVSILVEHAELSLLNLQRFEEVKLQTFVDDLTGLYNSRFLKYALTNSILRCKKPSQSFSVLFIDVDHFKKINDQNDHLIGSEFLVTIAKTVKNSVRSIDPVFRYGGDEFVVILNDTGIEGAQEIGERIRKNIERRIFVIRGKRIHTTVSIGIASYPEHATDRDTLLRLADKAMYHAKKSSRNAVHLAYGLENDEKETAA